MRSDGRWIEEQLMPLPTDFEWERFGAEERRVSWDGFLSYDGVLYGLPAEPPMAGSVVQVRERHRQVRVFAKGNLIATLTKRPRSQEIVARPLRAHRVFLGQHEADVLVDRAQLGDLLAPRSRKLDQRLDQLLGALAPEVMPTVSTPSSHSSQTWSGCRSNARRRRVRVQPRRDGLSWRSWSSQSPGPAHTGWRSCLTAI